MNTSLSHEGDLGSELPAMPSQAYWKVGSQVEVGWTVSAHHGGGYAYRLAPASAPLTEETFRFATTHRSFQCSIFLSISHFGAHLNLGKPRWILWETQF